ncbi:MAG: hypothetical protein LQ343_005569 [Gyalolechia ehrenbergii]|nr:MAG: hypothetical protein LQ343_005569 [Gyalolechia ehrenbergii]
MAKLASSKTATDDTPVAPKDINGNVTAENEIDDVSRGSRRKRAGDFFDFEEDEAVVGELGRKSAPTPAQPKKKSSQKAKAANSKTATDETPIAPKDINGNVTAENELDDPSPRSRRKRGGDFFDFGEDEAVVGGPGAKSAPTTAQPKKKSKTTKAADKKTKASKEDGHPIVTEKIHPGGDTVEAEPSAKTKTQKDERKPGRKDKAAKEAPEPAAKSTDSVKEGNEVKGKETSKKEKKDAAKPKARAIQPTTDKVDKEGSLKADSGKTDTAMSAGRLPSQAKAVKEISAPKKSRDTTDVESKAKPRKSKALDVESGGAAVSAKSTALGSSKRGKSKKQADAEDVETTPADDPNVSSQQAMDEAPFKKLLKRERGKIPAVKASADVAEAERKALVSADAVKALGKGGKTSKAKESKSARSMDIEAPKGKKRKEGPETAETKPESGPSEKKQKKARKSVLEVANKAVGAFVESGIEAAAQGVNAVKDLASGLGNESVAENFTAVAESAVDEKSKKAKTAAKRASKNDQKSGRSEGKDDAEPAADESGLDDEDEDQDEDNFEEGDQTLALIKGFESEGDDEVNDDEGFKEGMKVPQVPKNKDLTKKLKAAKDGDEEEAGVIYVGRIPHGFFEPQMRSYFSQFGSILRLRLSRNRTTGASKHYAFIEFASSSVASIVAETMNNYLLFGHILKCKLVPKEQVHENLWKGANKRFKKVPWAKIEGRKLDIGIGREQWEKRVETERKRRIKKGDKLKEIGYEFEAPEVKGVEGVKGKEVEKGIEEGTVEEKTVVTTDGGDGSMVVSEEVKTKVAKKGGKRKADEDKAEVAAPKGAKKAKKAKKSEV